MSTRHLVDPELLPMLDGFPVLQLSQATLPALREGIKAMLDTRAPPDLPVTVREIAVHAGGPDRMIRCLLVEPVARQAMAPAVLHFHGGGHVMGQPEMDLPQLMQWADALGALVVSVDYRLAPETRFPGPMEDGWVVLGWLHQNAADLGIDAGRIAVAGTSAGGAMAACLCLMARDRGQCPIAFQLLDMPRLDDHLPDPPNPVTGEFVWRAENSEFCRAAYLAGNNSPYGSAARARDLAGLPAACIMVGALDLFVDECLAYAARLIRAGVAVELIVYPGAFHGFRMAQDAAVTRRADADSLRALSAAFAR